MAIGLATALPCFLVPLVVVGAADRGKPLLSRYWVKANLWIAVFSFIGNYFWTHYFYRLLGAAYTFPAHNLNEVGRGVVSVSGAGSVVARRFLFLLGDWQASRQ